MWLLGKQPAPGQGRKRGKKKKGVNERKAQKVLEICQNDIGPNWPNLGQFQQQNNNCNR